MKLKWLIKISDSDQADSEEFSITAKTETQAREKAIKLYNRKHKKLAQNWETLSYQQLIKLSTGAEVPRVEDLTEAEMMYCVLIPYKDSNMPKDLQDYLKKAEKRFLGGCKFCDYENKIIKGGNVCENCSSKYPF